MRVLKPTLLAAAIASAVSVNVHADDSLSFAIEEVVVTAQKRAQSVNDIGVTVTAFGGDDIKELGFETANDLAANTPGLSSTNATSGGTPIFAIRGIGLDDFNSNNSSGVGVYIDEVFAAYPVFLNGQLFDVERVEVLKGPQGTLYGKNTTGGAINFVSVKPNDEFEGYLSAGLSRWNTYKVEGAINGNVAEGVNSRLAVSSTQGDGWQEDIHTDKEYGEPDVLAMRSLTSFELSDTSELLLNLHYSKDEGTPLSPQNTNADQLYGLPQGTIGSSDDASEVNVGSLDVMRDEEGFGASATLTVDFEDFTLTSITAFDEYKREVVDNFDGQSLSTDDFAFDEEFEVFSQELRLTSSSDGRFHWVAGLGFSKEEVKANTTADLTDLINGAINLPPAMGGFGLGVPVNSATASSIYTQDTTSAGAYLHTETDLTDQWMLTAGIRFSYDKREFDGRTVDHEGWFLTLQDLVLDLTADYADDGLANGSVPITPIVPPVANTTTASLDESETETNWSGKIGLDYTLNDDWLFYGSVATSYKAGIFYGSPAGAQEALAYIEPEEVLAYELGFKGSMLDGSLQLNGAVYHYIYENRQTSASVFSTAAQSDVSTLATIEESEISGAELEFRWIPAMGWDIRAGVSYIDSEVTEAPEATVRGLQLTQPVVEGDELAQAPKWSYNTVVRYEWSPLDGYMASAMANYSWIDEQAAGVGVGEQGIYGEVDTLRLRFSFGPEDQQWLVSAWVDNLENHNATTYAFTNTDGSQLAYHQKPRNYGVEVTYNF